MTTPVRLTKLVRQYSFDLGVLDKQTGTRRSTSSSFDTVVRATEIQDEVSALRTTECFDLKLRARHSYLKGHGTHA